MLLSISLKPRAWLRGSVRGELRCASSRKEQRRRRAKARTEETPVPEAEDATGDASTEGPVERLSRDGKKIGWQLFPMEEEEVAYQKALEKEGDSDVPFVDLTNPGQASDENLPPLSRDQVLSSCLSVSSGIFVVAFLLRSFAQRGPDLGNDPTVMAALLSWSPQWRAEHVVVALAAAAAVSGARVLLYRLWPEFAVATDRSNKQVLTSLNLADLIVVSCIPGISEELLFRGGLIPALYADWRGVLISGAVFGILHRGGGRNNAFVLWAAAVGTLYGFAFLLTQDVYVPMTAHSCANLFSGMYWLSQQDDTTV